MKKLKITVGKKTYDVTVEVLDEGPPQAPRLRAGSSVAAGAPAPGGASPAPTPAPAAAPGSVAAPMAGVIKAVQVKPGDEVKSGQVLVILEAMKMENQIASAQEGTVSRVEVAVGDSVVEGQTLVVME